jgi:hypothetical protein
MLTRLRLAFRIIRGLGDAVKPTVTREQYDEMRAFYQQAILDQRKIMDQLTRALIEERSPGTMSRLVPVTVKKASVVEEPAPEMLFP